MMDPDPYPRDDQSTATRPCVSVIIPTRDRPQMLRDAIASVRAQTFTDYEVIVVVNGPGNPHISATLEASIGLKVVRIEQAGIAVALNAGIQAARGQWLAFIDDDDLWEPNRLEVALRTANATTADVIFCDIFIFDENGGIPNAPLRPQHPFSIKEAMTIMNYGGGCSATMARKSAVLAIGGFDPSFASPDYDLWIRLSWRYRIAWADAYLVWVRTHPQNTSKRISWAGITLRIQYKALKTLPRDLRHMRSPLLLAMLKVMMKGTETYVRLNWFRRFKRATPAGRGGLKPPIPAGAMCPPAFG